MVSEIIRLIKLRTLLLCDYVYLILAVLSLFYSYLMINYYPFKSKYDIKDTIIEGYIHSIFIDGNKLKIELIGKEKIIANYYFKDQDEKKNFSLKLGDYVRMDGEMNKPRASSIFNLFDYQKYLYNKQIFFLFKTDKITFVKNNTRLRYKIKQNMLEHIDKIQLSSHYIKALVIGNDDYFDDNISKSFQFNGVSHLFAISGSHINILAVVILSLLKTVKVEENKRYYIVMFFLLFYMFLTDYSGSVMRATIFFILLSINKMYYFNIKTVNILYLTLFVLLIWKPGLLYDVGFQFSFIISLYLILFQNIISKSKNYIKQTLIISVIAFLVSIPICINNFFQINILSPLLNIFFVPYVTFILFPLSFICLVLPFLDGVLSFFINILECISLYFNEIKIGELILAKPSFLIVLLYYLFITISIQGIFIKKYHYFALLCLLIIIHHNINFFNKYPYVVFLDVGQGDSIYVNLPHNKGNLLIDTGGHLNYEKDWQVKNNKYKIGEDSIIPYLHSIGVTKLDYLVLTHGDEDHLGESIDIVKQFKVSKVVLNSGSLTFLEESLINSLKDLGIPYSFGKKGDIITLNKYSFHILNPSDDINENDNSLVIYTNINDTSILLTGDISASIERKLINEYPKLNVDILKIGHHGSKTSTCEEFLDTIEPTYGIIQVGLNNRFNHPHQEVLKRLERKQIKVFQTSHNGSIKFVFRANEVTIISALT